MPPKFISYDPSCPLRCVGWSAGWLVVRAVGWLNCNYFLKSGKLHFHAPVVSTNITLSSERHFNLKLAVLISDLSKIHYIFKKL